MTKREPFLIDGKPAPSVTEIIRTLGFSTPGLMAWQRSCYLRGVDPDKVRDDAAARGTAVHAWIARHIKGEQQPTDDDPFAVARELQQDVKDIFAMWLAWFNARTLDVKLCEQRLVNVDERYHGTPDLVAVEDGEWTVYDWKTSSDDKPKLEHWLQVAAYADLVSEIDDIDAVQIGACIVVLQVDADGKCIGVTEHRRRDFNLHDYARLFAIALDAHQVHERIKDSKRAESLARREQRKAATVERNKQKRAAIVASQGGGV